MKEKVNEGQAFLVMLVVTTTVLLTVLSPPSYFPSLFSADATNGGRGDDSQTSEDLGKEEQDEEEESGEIIEGNPDVDQELLDELRGGETSKEGGTGGEEELGGDNLSREELEAELRDGENTKQAPIAISGENVYTVWWTNNTADGNDEVMFRASTDGGATFGDKINLSNTTTTDSQDAEIAADGSIVAVTWWERNQTSNESVAMISSDGGQTFGETLVLSANGTIGKAGSGGG
jgi:hypothetical protein